MSVNIPYQNTTVSPTGGANAFGGQGQEYEFTLAQISSGSQVTIVFTDQLTGLQTQVGFGEVTGIAPTYVSVFNNKVYALAQGTTYFSAEEEPEVWNDPNAAGDSFITMQNYYSTPENLVATAPYQGDLLFIFRRMVQRWATDPDPANYAIQQTLINIGTFAPLSVQPVGDMDVYMLYDSGVRSVRVRDASDNALIADIGTPIDAILQPLIASLNDALKVTCCGIVEPSRNAYWLYIPNPDGSVGTIFVFSYFPSSQIAAWSTYSPSYQSPIANPGTVYPTTPLALTLTYTGLTIGQRYAWLPGANEVSITNGTTILIKEGAFTATATTAVVIGLSATAFTGALSATTLFVPEKFVVYNGQVWARSVNSIYQFGGASNQAYDNCGVSFTIPYLDTGTPGTRKFFGAIDAALQGTWSIGFSSDYSTNIYTNVYNNTLSSFQLGRIPLQRHSTHMSFNGNESSSSYARFSSALIFYSNEEEKGQL